jgi:hypothetical protein
MPDVDIEQKPETQDALVADIERTRAELARTIDAISDRLNPANAARRALDQTRARAAQLDPKVAAGVAATAAGLTVAWFLLRRRNRRNR